MIGGGVRIRHAHSEMQKLAETTGVPVIPTTHDLYIGNIGIHGSYAANMAVSNCDVLFSIGTRFNDRITGKIGHFATHAAIIHIDIDPASISRNIEVDIPIVADAKTAISALLVKAQRLDIEEWSEQIEQWKSQYPISMKTKRLTPEKIIREIFDLIRTFGNGKYEGKGEGVSLFWDRFQKMCDIQFKCNAILRI